MNNVVCAGCGVVLESVDAGLDDRYNASAACRRKYDELAAFTQTAGDNDFIHQIVVDTYTAQHLGQKVKPIGGTFALVGLYLVFERGYTGRQVQLAHMSLAKTRREWPVFIPPHERAGLTADDTVEGLTLENYRTRVYDWGRAVWAVWSLQHGRIQAILQRYLQG